MNKASPRMRKIANHLIAWEAANSGTRGDAAMFSAIDRLRPHLANLMGQGGVRALLARSLVLASAEATWLRLGRVNADGDLDGLTAARVDLEPDAILDGRVVLLAQMLGLLVAFIGPSLTSRLIGEIWPHVPLQERDYGREDDDEKAR